jgi:hypothetical protein
MPIFRFFVDQRKAVVYSVVADNLEEAKERYRDKKYVSQNKERLPPIQRFVEDELGAILEKSPLPVEALPADVIDVLRKCATFLGRLRTEPPAPAMNPAALALQAQVLAVLANPVPAEEPSRDELIDITFAYADALDMSDEDRTDKLGSGADVVDLLWQWETRVRRAVGMLSPSAF